MKNNLNLDVEMAMLLKHASSKSHVIVLALEKLNEAAKAFERSGSEEKADLVTNAMIDLSRGE